MIGGDAVDALHRYLENDRKRTIDRYFGGDPEKATAIFYGQTGFPVTKRTLKTYWYRKLVQLRLIVPLKSGNKGNRYGKNLHEIRDTFRSKVTGICAEERMPPSMFEFFLGHQVDKNDYDKYCNDEVAVRIQYRKALPYLNVMTSNKALGLYDEEEVEAIRDENKKRIDDLEAKLNRTIEDMKKYDAEMKERQRKADLIGKKAKRKSDLKE